MEKHFNPFLCNAVKIKLSSTEEILAEALLEDAKLLL
jgi:hypothetical protein